MKKLLLTLAAMAVVATSADARINAVTGQQESMPWIDFIKLLAKNETALSRFVTGLELTTLGITPGTAVADFLETPSSAKLIDAITNETGTGVLVFNTSPTIVTPVITTSIRPGTDDGATLGDTTHNYSDLFLATGAVINYQNGNVALTHSSGILTMGTGEMRITTAGTNAASVITQGSTNALTNKTLVSPVMSTGLTASGSAANTFAGSTGTFLTSSGANTLSGDVSIAAGKDVVYAAGDGALDASLGTGLTKTTTGTTTVMGALATSTQALTGAGAVNVTTVVTKLTTSGVADALTLANGVDGQIKIIVHDVDSGSAVLTPTTKTGFTTITFTSVGESVTLVYVTTRGWIIVAINGAVAA